MDSIMWVSEDYYNSRIQKLTLLRDNYSNEEIKKNIQTLMDFLDGEQWIDKTKRDEANAYLLSKWINVDTVWSFTKSVEKEVSLISTNVFNILDWNIENTHY